MSTSNFFHFLRKTKTKTKFETKNLKKSHFKEMNFFKLNENFERFFLNLENEEFGIIW